MKAITLWQPWASLVALKVKTIETRSWRAPASLIGERIAIHAAAKPIGTGALYVGDGVRGWTNVTGEPVANGHQAMSGGGTDGLLICPLGAVVASAVLTACVPMVDYTGCKNATAHLCIVNESMLLHSPLDAPWPSGDTELIVSDQRPFGDFAPGRYAWLLDDITPCDPIPAKGAQRVWNWEAS